MTSQTMLDTANTPITVPEGGTGNNSAAYAAAYDLLLSNGGGNTLPIYDMVAIGANGVAGNFLLDNSSFMNPNWANIVGRLLSFQILTSGTAATYTPTSAAVTTLVVEMIGGGAGGGGCTGSVTTYAASTGGACGQYIQANLYIASGPFTYTVGAGGAGGTGSANGSTGGVTSFGTLSTGAAPAGQGTTATTTATGIFVNPPIGTISAPFPPSPGIGVAEALGQYGFYSSAICVAGSGGGSFYGGGTIGPMLTSAGTSAGVTGSPYGGGGSGCCSYLDATNTNQVGGTGGSGLIIVWEYS
jgi:hypothetical protein